ncbi:transporter associated domain-containing protein [Peptoniphilus stercorisuis]|uniref:Transporter-associated domain-containing protein n=1 Tax=Peptoniphilus stercorisuis TaxID=1436965 RepID=A0ABS4KEG6_9FIRM|nr:transporter associated domain-containing protein [Peptoniphilus stercorisuis]MBP2025561.1 hypothetical protein [Peptoniphilus stercorisuis]
MDKRNFLLKLNKVVLLFEVLISLLLLLGIVFSIPDIFKYYVVILKSDVTLSLELFKQFLSHVLLLVIAMEFVLLMVAHTDTTITHLIMLVIARKMLIVSENMPDLLIGVIAIAILFIVRKYLVQGSATSDVIFDGGIKVFSASMPISEINKQYNFNIDTRGFETLGGLVSKLFEEKSQELELGGLVDDGIYIYELQKVSNGVIDTISIHHV